MAFKNPYNILNFEGVSGANIQALPQNYEFELNMNTWWSAVIRAREFSDFTGLDALYSYVLKSSTVVRSLIESRLRPLKRRTFAVHVNGKRDERLTNIVKTAPFFRELVYQRGMANFTFARVIGVDKNGKTFIYPLRNLDIVNEAVRKQTYNIENIFYVKNHVNLFWMQSSFHSEDTLGLLEPISRDIINMYNAQNDWQTASQFNAVQQMMMYYENGDPKMETAAREAASQVGLGTVIVAGKTTDEVSGKVLKDLELENVYGSATADTFRTFKENIEQIKASITQAIVATSMLGTGDKNTYSERLVRAHIGLFRDALESDALDVQDWLNQSIVKKKLAYLLNEPLIENCSFIADKLDVIDIGDVEVYTKMLKDLGLTPTEDFVEKTGLSKDDVIGYGENVDDTGKRGKRASSLRRDDSSKGGGKNVVANLAKRLFVWKRPRHGE